MKQLSKKLLMASVAAAVWSAAGAAEKAPTLAEVLKASGIDVTGYLDATYTNFDTSPPMYQANTTEKNAFTPNAADLAVSYLPATGAGGMVEMMAGKDVEFNHAKGWNSTEFDLLQAYAQYATSAVTVMAGKFTTIAGAEVPQAPSNANISRSLLYTLAIPVTHTGLRATIPVSDALKFTAGVNNGWDVVKESAPGNCVGVNCADAKTLELGVAANPSKMLGLTAAFYSGEEAGTTAVGTRNLVDVVGTFNVTDALTLVLNYDSGDQEHGAAGGGKAKWNGVAAYANYAFTDKLRGSLRVESFDDKNCFRTSCTTGSQKLSESTVTVGYMVAKGFELRAEYRTDDSNKQVFTKGSGTTDKQNFYGLEAVYKF